MARALHQILQEQIEGALLGLAKFDLQAIELKPRFLADIVVETRIRGERAIFELGHVERYLEYPRDSPIKLGRRAT